MPRAATLGGGKPVMSSPLHSTRPSTGCSRPANSTETSMASRADAGIGAHGSEEAAPGRCSRGTARADRSGCGWILGGAPAEEARLALLQRDDHRRLVGRLPLLGGAVGELAG